MPGIVLKKFARELMVHPYSMTLSICSQQKEVIHFFQQGLPSTV